MRVRIYAVATVLAILVLPAFAVLSWLRVREPAYGGKTLSQWLQQGASPYSRVSPFARADEAPSDPQVALEKMGGQGVRYLWNETLVTETPFKLRLIKLAKKQSFVPINDTPANVRRMIAHAYFPAVAEWGASEIPLLLSALENPDADVRARAKNCLDWVLYKADPNASASELIVCLKKRKAATRQHAALAFRRVPSPAGTNALPLLQSMALKDRSADVRASSAAALGGLRPTNQGVVETLLQTARDREQNVRRAAILALAEIGPEAAAARPELERLLNQPRPEFVPELREALQKTAARKPPAP